MTTAPVADASAAPRQRFHGLDALRGGALLLGIVLHGVLAYVPGFPWVVVDRHTSPTAGIVSLWIHMFRMVVFMFIAGFFARMSVGRRGAAAFVRDRLQRIGLPLLVFGPLMMAAVAAVAITAFQRAGEAPPPPRTDVPLVLQILSPGHLWFLWTLLQLYAVVLVLRAVARRLPWAERVGVRLGDLLTRPGGVLLPAATYWIAMEATHAPIGGPTTLVPEWPSTLAFLGAFLTGWFCWGRAEAIPRLVPAWPAYVGVALGLTVVVVVRLGATVDMEAAIGPWWLRAAYAVAAWCWCYGLIGLCSAAFRRENAAVRYLADSSYWLYIVHLPLVLLMQVWLVDLDWPAAAKAPVVIVVPTVVLLLSYDLLVRPTWLGKWLNGRKYASVLLG